jgi:outer membrane protein
MNKFIRTLSAVGAFGAVSLFAHAQTEPRIAVIDLAKIYDGHYETMAQNAKLKVDTAKAQDEIDQLDKAGQALVEEYKELVEQAKNPTATPDAKAKFQSEAEDKVRDIQAMQKQITDVSNEAKQKFQQRIQTFRTTMMQTISVVATDIAKRRGFTMLLDKSGPSLIGVSPVIYSDPSYDITSEVIAEINKNRPKDTPGSVLAPDAPEAPSSPEAAPKIVVPGITPQ